jgi:hypothetical protein
VPGVRLHPYPHPPAPSLNPQLHRLQLRRCHRAPRADGGAGPAPAARGAARSGAHAWGGGQPQRAAQVGEAKGQRRKEKKKECGWHAGVAEGRAWPQLASAKAAVRACLRRGSRSRSACMEGPGSVSSPCSAPNPPPSRAEGLLHRRNAQMAGRASVELHTLIFFRGRHVVADARVTKARRRRCCRTCHAPRHLC